MRRYAPVFHPKNDQPAPRHRRKRKRAAWLPPDGPSTSFLRLRTYCW
jgi:hypothetical protein